MKSDIEIASEAEILDISKIAQKLGISEYEPYGKFKAKLKPLSPKKGSKLILVSATSPTPYGEGKTTTSVGLADGIARLDKSVCLALREPSLGPVFGIKGGAAGGGCAQLVPMVDLNLHFTGDFAAIAAANNLIAAMVDNSIFSGNPLNIDPDRVLWKRAIDMNDRALRSIGLECAKGQKREAGFVITAASEIMAILCLCDSVADLKARICRAIVAYTYEGRPVSVGDIGCTDAAVILLLDAIKPNLIQSLERTPAIVHGGPFANIAHGCNSLIATRTALGLADYVVTEAGFGSDLGLEKFIDIKCVEGGLKPDAVVLVTTIRSIKFNSALSDDEVLKDPLLALKKGSENLIAHIENIRAFGLNPVVSLNKFSSDTDDEIEFIKNLCEDLGARFAVCEAFTKGSAGAVELAREVLKACESPSELKPCYDANDSVRDKILKIATRVYGASDVEYSEQALRALESIENLGFDGLRVCVAKTQYSLSDDAKALGRPHDFKLFVRDLQIRAGAGFIVAICGAMMLLPGLSKHPAALDMRVDDSGHISGLA
ncbi:formate--tetrahydrofolate ligase [Campylobacter sp. 19-13652]|uniref:formate--tetrahydrofolate ligase n=1 Tax=Campylobacter sp. 19-13652 TaxID=2840180 RepID=UPI001C76E603|nr:formate--tetrahydrofolate ligase [Campylobacter sp. 19-13652]BCX80209.1 formate--tetrahydrofolate ligase [Campylobacter sp. 19-13652]